MNQTLCLCAENTNPNDEAVSLEKPVYCTLQGNVSAAQDEWTCPGHLKFGS